MFIVDDDVIEEEELETEEEVEEESEEDEVDDEDESGEGEDEEEEPKKKKAKKKKAKKKEAPVDLDSLKAEQKKAILDSLGMTEEEYDARLQEIEEEKAKKRDEGLDEIQIARRDRDEAKSELEEAKSALEFERFANSVERAAIRAGLDDEEDEEGEGGDLGFTLYSRYLTRQKAKGKSKDEVKTPAQFFASLKEKKPSLFKGFDAEEEETPNSTGSRRRAPSKKKKTKSGPKRVQDMTHEERQKHYQAIRSGRK